MKAIGLTPGMEGKTMVIQGLGNVGSYAGIISQEEGGARVIGISEIEGTIVSNDNIDIKELIAYRKANKTIIGFPGTTQLKDRDNWINIKCDILVPAALESQIRKENAKKVNAKIIGEAANGPITADARRDIIEKRNSYTSGYVSKCRWCYSFIF